MPKPKSPAMFTRRTRRERMGLNPSEHTEAVRFMRVVRLHEPRYPALCWLFAIPNGGWRNLTVAQKLKAEGVRPGVHDYLWPYKAGTYSGLSLELKSGKNTATKEQRDFAEFMEAQGHMVVFANGWEAAWKAVCEYAGIPYRVA